MDKMTARLAFVSVREITDREDKLERMKTDLFELEAKASHFDFKGDELEAKKEGLLNRIKTVENQCKTIDNKKTILHHKKTAFERKQIVPLKEEIKAFIKNDYEVYDIIEAKVRDLKANGSDKEGKALTFEALTYFRDIDRAIFNKEQAEIERKEKEQRKIDG